jgi:hypothetical protein
VRDLTGKELAIVMRIALILIFLLLHTTFAAAGVCSTPAAETFEKFFSRFSTDKHFSVSRTLFPLRALKSVANARSDDESLPRRFHISRPQYEAMPSLAAYMDENALGSRLKHPGKRVATVEIFKEDSDWLTSHHFKRIGNCWFLYEYQDHSL